MDKLIINCTTGKLEEANFTIEEIAQQITQQALAEEQAILDSLIPSEKEILMAEVEIQTITILMEVGLI